MSKLDDVKVKHPEILAEGEDSITNLLAHIIDLLDKIEENTRK